MVKHKVKTNNNKKSTNDMHTAAYLCPRALPCPLRAPSWTVPRLRRTSTAHSYRTSTAYPCERSFAQRLLARMWATLHSRHQS